MFSDWDNFQEEDEILELVKQYQDMLVGKSSRYFDLYEYESIVDFYVEQFNFKEALQAVRKGIHQHSYSSSLKIKYIQILIETGKPGKALGIIRSLNEMESSNYELFLAKGIALNLTGKPAQAQVNFEQALNLCEDGREDVIYNVGQSYMQIENYPLAIQYLQMAFELNPENILVLHDLALSYDKMGLPEKSIAYYKQYLDLDPFAEHVWNSLGMMYSSLEDNAHALDAFDFAIAINPGYFSAYYNKADLYMINGETQLAIDVYTSLISQDVYNTKAWNELGNCHEEIGNYTEALGAYEHALKISGEFADAWFGKGMVFYKLRKHKFAINAFLKATTLQTENSDYWFMLGEAYAGSRKLNLAIQAYSRATELNPFDFEAWLACAQVLFRKRKVEEAINVLLELYPQNHKNPTLNYRLAAYHAYLLDYINACRFFERALKLNFLEHRDMFRQYPKTKLLPCFKNLVREDVYPGSSIKQSK